MNKRNAEKAKSHATFLAKRHTLEITYTLRYPNLLTKSLTFSQRIIGARHGYSFLVYKTDTWLHNLPQRRRRYVMWFVLLGDPGDFLMSVIVEHWQQFSTYFYKIVSVVLFFQCVKLWKVSDQSEKLDFSDFQRVPPLNLWLRNSQKKTKEKFKEGTLWKSEKSSFSDWSETFHSFTHCKNMTTAKIS